MKKKSLWALIVSLFMIIPTMFVFSACKEKHEHEYLEQWSSDATKHWHDCTGVDCDAKSDEADHLFEENWVEGKAATCEEDGVEHLYCSVCGYYKSRVIPKDSTKHLYEAVYTWNEDNTKCTAQNVCSRNSEHKSEPVEGVVTPQVTKEATCEEEGEITYTATFEGTEFAQQTKIVKTAVNPDNHAGGALTYEWNADKTTCTAKLVCSRNASHVIATETATATRTVVKEANCTETGSAKMTATFTNSKFATQEETVAIAIDSTKHDELAPVYTWNEDKTQCTAKLVCGRNASHVIATETIATSNSVTKQANCAEKGERTYVAEFTNAKFSRQTEAEEIAATGIHDYNETGTADTSTHKYTIKCKNCEQAKEYDLYTYEYSEAQTFNIILKDDEYVVVDGIATINLIDETNEIYSISSTDIEEPVLVVVNSSNYTFDNFKAETFGETGVDYYLFSSETEVFKFIVFTKNNKSYADQYESSDYSENEPTWTYGATYQVTIENSKFNIMGMTYDIKNQEDMNVLSMQVTGNSVYEAEDDTFKYSFRDNGLVYLITTTDIVQGSAGYEKDSENDKVLILKLSELGGEDQYFYIYEEGKASMMVNNESNSYSTIKSGASYIYINNGIEYLFTLSGEQLDKVCLCYVTYNESVYMLNLLNMTWEETETEGVKTITLTNGTETKEFTVDSSDETGKTLVLKQA